MIIHWQGDEPQTLAPVYLRPLAIERRVTIVASTSLIPSLLHCCHMREWHLTTYPLIRDTMSPCMLTVSLILPSLTSPSRIGFRSVYLIPVRALNLLRFILPPLSASIHRIRSRGDCEMFDIVLDSVSYYLLLIRIKSVDTHSLIRRGFPRF